MGAFAPDRVLGAVSVSAADTTRIPAVPRMLVVRIVVVTIVAPRRTGEGLVVAGEPSRAWARLGAVVAVACVVALMFRSAVFARVHEPCCVITVMFTPGTVSGTRQFAVHSVRRQGGWTRAARRVPRPGLRGRTVWQPVSPLVVPAD